MSIQILALDIDGTVFSSEDIILETYAESITEFARLTKKDIITPSHDRIMKEIGQPVKTIFQNLLPELQESDREKISDRILSLLVEKIQSGRGHYYDKIEITLRDLHSKGFKLTGCSNGRSPYIEAILKQINILSLFQPLVVLDDKSRIVKGDILLHYIKEYQVPAKHILMVGDRYSDWEAAQKAGTPFAFCAYGHADPGEIPSYDFILEKPSDLAKILL